MKKFLVYMCALVISLNVMGVDVSAETVDKKDISIASYTVTKDTISEGTEFTLTVNLSRKASAANKDIDVSINPGSFIVKDKGLLVNLGTSNTLTIPMKCSGTNNTITLTCSYTGADGKIYESVNPITIDMVKYSDSGSSSPTDTSKYTPELVIENQKIPTANAGSDINLALKLKNAGTYTAKNITVELVPPTDKDFSYETNTISLIDKIQQLKKTDTAELNYSFLVKDSTPAKTYSCQLKYTYFNLYGDKVDKTQDIYIKVRKGFPSVDLRLSEVTNDPEIIKAGQKVNLSFLVNNNNGLSTVSSIDVKLEDLDKGFTIVDGVNSRRITNLRPDVKGEKISFDLFASSTLKKGSYPITVNLKYKDSSNAEKEIKKEVYLMVDSGNTDIAIRNIKAPTGQINASQPFNLSFDIVNTGEVKAEDLIVTVKGDEEIVPMSQNIQVINEMEVGATKQLTYKFQPTEEATTKTHLLNIEIKGKDETAFTTINQYVGVYVKAKKENKEGTTSKPIIIVDNFTIVSESTESEITNAGENFALTLYFKNTHDSKKVQNIKVSLGAEENSDTDKAKAGSVFTPVESSSTFFIKEIAPGQSIEKQLKIFTIPFAASKVHNLKLDIYYEYENDEKLLTETIKDAIPITVIQPSSFITSDIKIPETMIVGNQTDVEFDISNTGRTSLDNFTVQVEGFGSTNSRNYIGNLETGRSTYYSNEIWVDEEGEVTGTLIFTYTKPDGKEEEVRKEFKTVGQAMDFGPSEGDMGMDMGDFDKMPGQEKKSNKTLIIIISSVAAVAVIVTIIIVRRKIKKKKEMNFDE
ncbi:hypothetical protein AN1V17_32820 [Vallitalea sediminicola]